MLFLNRLASSHGWQAMVQGVAKLQVERRLAGWFGFGGLRTPLISLFLGSHLNLLTRSMSGLGFLSVQAAGWVVPGTGSTQSGLFWGRAQLGLVAPQRHQLEGSAGGTFGYLSTLFLAIAVTHKQPLAEVSRPHWGAWVVGRLLVSPVGDFAPSSKPAEAPSLVWLDRGFFFPSLAVVRQEVSAGRPSLEAAEAPAVLHGRWAPGRVSLVQPSESAWQARATRFQTLARSGGFVYPTQGGNLGTQGAEVGPVPISGDTGAGLGLTTQGGLLALAQRLRGWNLPSAPFNAVQRRFFGPRGSVSLFPVGGALSTTQLRARVWGLSRLASRGGVGSRAGVALAALGGTVGTFQTPEPFRRQPQVRYRPGFLTHWRSHRSRFRLLFRLPIGEGQHQLTRYLSRFRRVVSFSYFRLAQLSLDQLLAVSWLGEPVWQGSIEQLRVLVARGWAFVNGVRCLNPRRQLHLGDCFLLAKTRALAHVAAAPVRYGVDQLAYASQLSSQSASTDTPPFLEVDELVCGGGVLYEPRAWYEALGLPLFPFMTVKCYNWKYLT